MRAKFEILAAAMALSACPLAAADSNVTAADPAGIAQALRDAGHEAKLDTDNYGDPLIHTKFGGYGGLIVFYGCDEKTHAGCDAVQFRAGLDRKTPMPAALVNTLMAKRRFAAIWLDEDGDPWVNFDVLMGSGMPKSTFMMAYNAYSDGIGEVADAVFADESGAS